MKPLEALKIIKSWLPELDNNKMKLVKVDIKELYPSIPPVIAVDGFMTYIQNNGHLDLLLNNLKTDSTGLANVILNCITNNIVKFNDKLFKQIKGLPIGSCLSGLMADFYLCPLLNNIQSLMQDLNGQVIRYVDDFLFLIPVDVCTQYLLEHINSLDENIMFTVEAQSIPLPYLQFEIDKINNEHILKWYRKPQSGTNFLHFDCNTSFSSKRANVFNHLALFDIIDECNNNKQSFRHNNRSKLLSILKVNNYPERLVNIWFTEYDTNHSKKPSVDSKKPSVDKTFINVLDGLKNERINVAADGHCLLHCFSSATCNREEKLKAGLENFIVNNLDNYRNFLPIDWKTQLSNYCNNRNWKQDIVDVLPVILADYTSYNLQIISKGRNNDNVSITTHKCTNKVPKGDLTLILENGHYTYIKSNSQSVTLNDPATSTVTTDNKDRIRPTEYMKPNLVIPFKSNSCTTKIRQFKNNLKSSNLFNICFKSEGRLVDIVRMVQINSKKTVQINKSNTVQDKSLSSNQNDISDQYKDYCVVYMATCLECKKNNVQSNYIGETGRTLTTRKKEHLKNINVHLSSESNSAIGLHELTQHGSQPSNENWEFKILCHSSKTQNRKALEAYMIRKFKPNLNRDSGVYIII